MKMICSILLLLSLTSCVSGAFVVNVTQTSYQAEENHNITLEWMFPTRTSSSPNSLFIYCQLFTDHKASVLFHLHEGVEDPESQDEQFTGRVRWDKDVLRDGRIRLHMSRLRINDSGVYRCDVLTGYDSGSGICHLKVTAAADEPKPLRPTRRPQPERPTMRPQPERPTMRPQPESWGRIGLYVGLGLAALLVLCAGLYFAFLLKFTGKRGNINRAVQKMSFLKEQLITSNQASTSSAEIRSCLEGNPQAAKPAKTLARHNARQSILTSTIQRQCLTLNIQGQCLTSRSMPNLNHSRSMPNLNHSRSMPDLKHSRSMPKFNHSRSMPNLNHSRSMPNLNHSRSMPNLNHSRSMPNLNHSRSMPNFNYLRYFSELDTSH